MAAADTRAGRRGPAARPLGMTLALAVCLGLAALAWAAAARAAEPLCLGSSMHFVAHQDDDLLFQSPTLLEDVRSDACVRTVFLTAGDDGQPPGYWEGREAGIEAAYAQMAGVADNWTASTLQAEGHPLRLITLTAAPRISVVFMRLPDGDVSGEGYAAYGSQSLLRLWAATPPPHGIPPISTIEAVDGSTSYSKEGLTAALAALIGEVGPTEISTQNFEENFFEGDHPDHIATAYFVRKAQLGYPDPHLLKAYKGYDVSDNSVNVGGSLLSAKQQAFYLYGTHDVGACTSEVSCASTAYKGWLEREYVTGTESTPGAVAGNDQTALVGKVVELDGSGSFDPGGEELEYEWEQTGGPHVVLSDPADPEPSFTGPAAPATLTFSLTVANEERESLPADVTVTFVEPEPEPEPEHGNPGDNPSTGGSGGEVGGGAGGGGGAGNSSPPPSADRSPTLQRQRVNFVAGKPSRQLIRVLGSPRPSVRCRGPLPRGIRCKVTAAGNVLLISSRAATATGTFLATIVASNRAGTIRRLLTVRVRGAG